MTNTAIALLHPGDMGSAIGACAVRRGHKVLCALQGRSGNSRQRAKTAGLLDLDSLEAAVAQAAVVLSVCPPHGALQLARRVAGCGFKGLFVDANAIAPATTRQVAELIAAGGASFLDGGIIGAPPGPGIRSSLYLSGGDTAPVQALFAGTPLAIRAADGPPGAASALKACYAAWNKGATALLANIRALAVREGVEAPLVQEWQHAQPDALKRTEHACSSARKAWRWVGEMDEIATAFREAGLPDGFHLGASEIFRRLENFKDAPVAPSIEAVTGAIISASGPRR